MSNKKQINNNISDPNTITFQHWLHRPIDKNWITVAQHKEGKYKDLKINFFTTSVLAKTNSSEHLLVNHEWLANQDFGNPKVWEDDNKIHYDDMSVEKFENTRVEPFVIYRTWNNGEDPKFELIQNFILFYNLFFDEKENTYKATSDAGEEINVIKITHGEHDQKIEINICFLRNYLAFKNRILIIQHHHSLHSNKTLEDFKIKPTKRLIKNNEYSFELIIDKHHLHSSFSSYSSLLGKCILLPFTKQKNLLEWPKKYCEFIIGVDDEGENIESTCEEGKMKAHFLTPVFFNAMF